MRRLLVLGLLLAAALPATAAQAASSVTYNAGTNVFTYAGDSTSVYVSIGTKVGNGGDLPPTPAGTDAQKWVFLDASIPAVAPCVDYNYDPPDIFGPTAPRKVGVVCTPSSMNATVVASGGGGDDTLTTASSCGFFLSFSPCTANPTRAMTLDGGDGNDVLTGGAGPNTLTGGAGDDDLTGGGGVDALDGGSGRDTLTGLLGADDLRGGAGIDEVRFDYTNDRVLVDLDDVADDGAIVPGPVEGDNVRSDIEDITGGGGPDILTGSSVPNTLTGGDGDDQIDGGGGIDIFYGQAGADTLATRDGNAERVDCGDGSDVATTDTGDQRYGCEVDNTNGDLEGDLDADGVKAPADCNDTDPAIKPGATDAPDNGVDENCDGVDATIRDRDGDTVTAPADCDDANPAAKPGAVELYGNTVDEDCNGAADPFRSISSFVSSGFRAKRRTTSITLLKVMSVRAGSTVTVTCAGKPRACGFSSKKIAVTKETKSLDVRSRLKLRSAKVGGRIDVRISHPDSLSKRTRFTFRRSKVPSTKTQCVSVKTGKYATCP